MKISVVIPAFNEEKLLPATLQAVGVALGAFHDRGWMSEIVVCDNNSTDQTTRIAQTHGVKVIFEPVNQIARARNTGASAATGDWLIFVDADSSPSRELFSDVADAITGGRCLGGGVTLRLETAPPEVRLINAFWNGISRTLRYAAGSFIFCEAAAFRALGGFSHELYVSEEIEFSQRLKKLARQRGLRLLILHRHPMLTSARKLSLYSRAEHLRFVLRILLSRGRHLRSRDHCHIWYDGRR